MHQVESRESLAHAPECREPGAEAVARFPDRYARALLAALPAGVAPTAVRRVMYVNFANDPCVALLIESGDGHDYLVLNELGPDAHGEVAHAGGRLARELGVTYSESPPSHWSRATAGFWARLFGYAA